MKKELRWYISGPVSGIPGGNAAAFAAEAERLRALGYFVFNPMEIDLDEGATWEQYMRADLIAMLDTCNALMLLPGWRKSRGASLEHRIARALGFEISLAAGEPPALAGEAA
jgi:hypothetical protein